MATSFSCPLSHIKLKVQIRSYLCGEIHYSDPEVSNNRLNIINYKHNEPRFIYQKQPDPRQLRKVRILYSAIRALNQGA